MSVWRRHYYYKRWCLGWHYHAHNVAGPPNIHAPNIHAVHELKIETFQKDWGIKPKVLTCFEVKTSNMIMSSAYSEDLSAHISKKKSSFLAMGVASNRQEEAIASSWNLPNKRLPGWSIVYFAENQEEADRDMITIRVDSCLLYTSPSPRD